MIRALVLISINPLFTKFDALNFTHSTDVIEGLAGRKT